MVKNTVCYAQKEVLFIILKTLANYYMYVVFWRPCELNVLFYSVACHSIDAMFYCFSRQLYDISLDDGL